MKYCFKKSHQIVVCGVGWMTGTLSMPKPKPWFHLIVCRSRGMVGSGGCTKNRVAWFGARGQDMHRLLHLGLKLFFCLEWFRVTIVEIWFYYWIYYWICWNLVTIIVVWFDYFSPNLCNSDIWVWKAGHRNWVSPTLFCATLILSTH